MNYKKIIVSGIVSGIALLIVSMIISFAIQAAFNFNMLNLAGMRAASDPIMLLFFLQPIVMGLAIAYLYDFAKASFKGNETQNGISLGLLTWVVYSIPSAWMVASSMSYPLGFTVNSLVGGLVSFIVAGIIIVKLSK